MQMFKDKLRKDFGNDNSLWYCMNKECTSVYNKTELFALDVENKVIWGKISPDLTAITPICSIHGRFLLYLEEQPEPKTELLL